MKEAKLITPEEKYLLGYLEACKGFKENSYFSYLVHDPDMFEEWKDDIFDTYENLRTGKNLDKSMIPASYFWLVEGNEFVGIGNIRHSLTPALELMGGNIGYAITPKKWNQGYGSHLLKLLLVEAKRLGLSKVLLTCNDTNIASYRIMEKNGAVYQDTIDNYYKGILKRTIRYWIDIK